MTADEDALVIDDAPLADPAQIRRAMEYYAALAGCRPEYFPVVLAAWDSFRLDGGTLKGIWQSTTGTAPFDQATQGTPAKYTCCIAENEEDSPWAPLHVDNGLAADDSACSSTVIRSVAPLRAGATLGRAGGP